MAHTLIDHVGQSTTPTITGLDNRTIYGPPVGGATNYQGVFVRQTGTPGTYTYRWVKDERTSAAVTAYTQSGDHRS